MVISGSLVTDQLLQLRFATSGQLSHLHFSIGNRVSKGQLLARLNQSDRQTYLDRALKQYEKTRAEFDAKTKTDLTEYERTKLQSELDISVKNVELAKIDLEATNLYSPITGLVVAADSGAVGMNITPAAFTITLLDPNSIYFQGYIDQKDLSSIEVSQPATIALTAYPDLVLTGQVTRVGFLPHKSSYPVAVSIDGDKDHLRLGLTGKATLTHGQEK